MRRDKLVKASWNYKKPAKPEELQKLAASIARDSSAGVLPVRELSNGMFEVIDGNHRKDAIDVLEWDTVLCENFGAISTAEAVLISRRRNYQWFEDDLVKLAELYRDEVLPMIEMSLLDEILPEGAKGVEALVNGLAFSWDDPAPEARGWTFGYTPQRRRLWDKWVSLCEAHLDIHDRSAQFDRALLVSIKSLEPDSEMSECDDDGDE